MTRFRYEQGSVKSQCKPVDFQHGIEMRQSCHKELFSVSEPTEGITGSRVVTSHKAQRRTSGPQRDKLSICWRKIAYDEINNLYSSKDIIRLRKSRNVRWAGNVAYTRV